MKKLLATAIVTAILVFSGQLAYMQTSKWVVATNAKHKHYRDVDSSLLKKMNDRYKRCEYKLDTISTTDPKWLIERDIAAECTRKATAYWKPLRQQVIDVLEKGRTKYKVAKMLDWME